MNQPAPSANSKRRFSRVFLVALGTIGVLAVVARPAARWSKAQYDAYKNSTSHLLASQPKHQALLKTIQASQSSHSANRPPASTHSISEKIFQAALLPDTLGRSSRYEPYTHNGKLACARMVNLVIDRALGYQVGQNPLYVPSMVEDLDRHRGKRIEQAQTMRGDLAISNGTDYANGLWHIGICMNAGCRLVLSNSPFKSEFSWLTDAEFDGAFEQYPGETTFYRITQPGSKNGEGGIRTPVELPQT